MNETAISALESQVPQVFPKVRRGADLGDYIIVEGEIFSPSAVDDAIITDTLQGVSKNPSGADADFDEDDVNRIQGGLAEILGRAGTGARGPTAPWRRRSGFPPPDCFAAYLPWHYFDNQTWGIYLLVEGVDVLSRYVYAHARGNLSHSDALKIAKVFLFHHEAYHNAVETFAARNEVASRVAFYIAEIERLYQKGMVGIAHEEALATAYAMQKTAGVFAKSKDPVKHNAAIASIETYVGKMPQPYADALRIWNPRKTATDRQSEFAEQARAGSLAQPPLSSGLWEGFPHAFRPSLLRNGRFSWLIHRGSPLASRIRADVRYFSRRDFVRALKKTVGGQEVAGGKHPHWRTAGGHEVPVPGHRELDIVTCRKILKQLGVADRLEDVMGSV